MLVSAACVSSVVCFCTIMVYICVLIWDNNNVLQATVPPTHLSKLKHSVQQREQRVDTPLTPKQHNIFSEF